MSILVQIQKFFQARFFQEQIFPIITLLRWNKPSGRLILLIPAGWSLWLAPSSPPSLEIIFLITAGTIFISGAGCITNDLWDKKIDKQVTRTRNRPLANETLTVKKAYSLLFLTLFLSLMVVISLPNNSKSTCLGLALTALPLIIIYPSAKRWFKYPQAILSLCWGYSVLIPWAAIESKIVLNAPLVFCWCSVVIWTFGFDTVYALSDKDDDIRLRLKSSAISLGKKVLKIVSFCYLISCLCLASAAYIQGVNYLFWIIWSISSIIMQLEVRKLSISNKTKNIYGLHFRNQVLIGSILLLGLIIGKL